jgi:hypothetical protein
MDVVLPNRNERGDFYESLEKIQFAARLNHYMSKRIKAIPHSNGEFDDISDLHVKWTAATFFGDITADPKHWKNICFADYFNLEKVSLKK